MDIVYICSPYAGKTTPGPVTPGPVTPEAATPKAAIPEASTSDIISRNIEMAKRYCRMAADRGCIPLAPHLLLPQFLSEEKERDLAISMDLRLLDVCQEIWVCGDFITSGMRREIERASTRGIPIKFYTGIDMVSIRNPDSIQKPDSVSLPAGTPQPPAQQPSTHRPDDYPNAYPNAYLKGGGPNA